MLVVYILSKHRFLRIKWVRNKEAGFFKQGGYEYRIDRKRIYTKKFLGFKTFFWCMYLEGNPNPIEFDDKGIKLPENDVPLDEIAILIRKIVHGIMEIATLILIIINIIMTAGLIYMVDKLG